MNTTDQISDAIKPPYISSSKMQKLTELLSTRNFSQLSVNDLKSRGFSLNEASQGLQALRFLGLADANGNILETARVLLLKGEARSQGLAEIVRISYSKLFNVVAEAPLLPRDELYNEFIATYDLSTRLTKSALPLFIWLCKESGIEVSAEVRPRPSGVKRKQTEAKPAENKPNNSGNTNDTTRQYFHDFTFFSINVSIPKTRETELLIAKGELSEVVNKLEEFSRKAGLSKLASSTAKNDGEVA